MKTNKNSSILKAMMLVSGMLTMHQPCYGWWWSAEPAATTKTAPVVTAVAEVADEEGSDCGSDAGSVADEDRSDCGSDAGSEYGSEAGSNVNKEEVVAEPAAKNWNLVGKRSLIVAGVGATALAIMYGINTQTSTTPWETTKDQLKSPFVWIENKLVSPSYLDKAKGVSAVLGIACCTELLASYIFNYDSKVVQGFNKIKDMLP